jgi:hypothetical protein
MVEQLRPTFAEQDRILAAREGKAVECIERLRRVLVAEFDADEMRFIRNWTLIRFASRRSRARRTN